jgi:hypothetical protein
VGSSLRGDKARIAAKAATAVAVTGASVPPQNMTSARPRRIASKPSPSAMFDAAQAVLCASSGPRVPSSIDTQPAGRFGSVCAIDNGFARAGPRLATWSTACSNEATPPRALPTATPARSPTAAASR